MALGPRWVGPPAPGPASADLLITLLLGSVGAGMAVWTWETEAIAESRTAVQAIPERSGVANHTDGTIPTPDNAGWGKEGIDEEGGYAGGRRLRTIRRTKKLKQLIMWWLDRRTIKLKW